jgi:hypothetical protein
VVGGTQVGLLEWTGGDSSGALSGFNAGAGEKESGEEPARSCTYGQEGGSGAGNATRRQVENGARHLVSCAGAAETGAGRAVSGAVREQGSGWHAWAVCEHVGRPGKGRS